MPAITKKSIDKLRERIVALQVRDKDFVLSSGASGKHYIDIKGACLEPESLYTIAGTFVMWMKEMNVSVAGGGALGADPIVGAMVAISDLSPFNYPIKGFIVRKSLSEFGTDNLVEGFTERGATAVIVDDVLSTGSSTLRIAQMARGVGMNVKGVFAVVDKMRGGAQKVVSAGFECRSLFTLASLKLPD
ncbi:MAG: hypothetical protein JW759_09505 [Candidatus Coatesbacteria bacterium]|nr:hypothetical protein [Candidatus Coatesbacteria bacterium]